MKLGSTLSTLYKGLFHKRNIIVMSERSTSHMSMSGKLQFTLMVGIIAVIGTASFSTGQYMAAKEVISEQDKTLRSVANSRIKSNYDYAVPSLSTKDSITDAEAFAAPLTDQSYSFSNMNESKLVARIAFLENRVGELKQTNQDIVKVVRKTAAGQIKGLEDIIAKTGLSPDLLKRHAKQEKKIRHKPTARLTGKDGHQGGPYIPAYWDHSMQRFAEDLEVSTDQLYVLRQILKIMPIDSPMPKARKTSGFGHRRDPFTGRVAFHAGLDFASKTTPQIVATSDGTVSMAKSLGSYGKLVELQHGLGLSTRYAHLSRILVKPGAKVKKGQVIGIQGSTGRSTGAHLHYEIRFGGRALNPGNFLKAGAAYVQQNNS